MLSIPFFRLTHPFLLSTPTEWMTGLKTHNTLCQAIMVQNYRPPVARLHLDPAHLSTAPVEHSQNHLLQPRVFIPNNGHRNQIMIKEVK